MAKRMQGAGVNRSAARKASEVAAARQTRLAAHEAAVTAAVATFFDRTGRATDLRHDAKVRAERLLADADTAARVLDREADHAVAALKKLGEPVVEIATMTGLPVSTVRAALARAATIPVPPASAEMGDGPPQVAVTPGATVAETSKAAVTGAPASERSAAVLTACEDAARSAAGGHAVASALPVTGSDRHAGR